MFFIREGDLIQYQGQTLFVKEIIQEGRKPRKQANSVFKGEKAHCTACRIMSNGQVLHNSPIYVGPDWEKA